MRRQGVGIIGCGVIADIYCQNAPRFRDIELQACADLRPEAAAVVAERYGLRALSPAELLADDRIDIVLNLTVPAVHAEVSKAALEAGKHVYTEKPLATSLADAKALVELAERQGLRIAAAPDTVLGAASREARRLIDEGAIGQVIAGTAFFLSRGMEHWHPNPGFFFQPGGGPVFDIGPYYLTQLVQLLGPVARVGALTGTASPTRLVSAPGPFQGETIPVATPTTALALLQFAAGAQIMFGTSWDIARNGHRPFELYGTAGSLRVPDPNFMHGALELGTREADWQRIETDHLVFGQLNWPAAAPTTANDRGLGLAELARAIREDRPHRLSAGLALHVTALMAAILAAGAEGRFIEVEPPTERPPALDEAEAAALLVPA